MCMSLYMCVWGGGSACVYNVCDNVSLISLSSNELCDPTGGGGGGGNKRIHYYYNTPEVKQTSAR